MAIALDGALLGSPGGDTLQRTHDTGAIGRFTDSLAQLQKKLTSFYPSCWAERERGAPPFCRERPYREDLGKLTLILIWTN